MSESTGGPTPVEKAPVPAAKIESAGASNRGGRSDKPDEDSLYSGSKGYHLGEIDGGRRSVMDTKGKISQVDRKPDETQKRESLAQRLNGLQVERQGGKTKETLSVTSADIENTHQQVQELISRGVISGLDIVADGMGGQGTGEVASSIATYMVVKEVVAQVSALEAQKKPVNEQVMRNAVRRANEVLVSYNKAHNLDSGTTIVAALTDTQGAAIVASVGDSRIYRQDAPRVDTNGKTREGNVRLISEDQSLVQALLTTAEAIRPSEVYTHPNKNLIQNHIGNANLEDSQIQSGRYLIPPGGRLMLVCDGVWEGIDTQDPVVQQIMKRADKHFDAKVAELMKVYPGPQARKMAAQEAFGMVFQEVNMAGIGKDTTTEQVADKLTETRVGQQSHDNTSAVVLSRSKDDKDLPREATPALTAVESQPKTSVTALEIAKVVEDAHNAAEAARLDPDLQQSLQVLDAALSHIVGDGAAQSLLQKERQELIARIKQRGSDPTESERKQLTRIQTLEKKLEARRNHHAGMIDASLIRLIGPENSTPQEQAFGYDLQRHLWRRTVAENLQEIDALKKASGDQKVIEELEKQNTELAKKIQENEGKRKEIADANPDLKNDLVVQVSLNVSEAVNPLPLTDEEKARATSDPLGVLEDSLILAAENPNSLQSIVDLGLLTQKQAENLRDEVTMKKERSGLKWDDRLKVGQRAGFSLLAALVLMGYMGSKKKQGG